MSESGRRDTRHRCTLPIVLNVGRTKVRSETEDVSFSGLFVLTEEELPIRQLLVVEAPLPGGEPFSAHAMVVFSRAKSTEKAAGAGLKFFGLSREALERWVHFVRGVRARQLATPEPPPAVVPATGARGARAAVVLRVRPQGLDGLVEVYTRDLAEGGMFFETDQPLLVGSHLLAEIVHPDTGETFELACVVRRAVREKDSLPGLGVEFTDLDDSRRQQLHEFVSSALPPIVLDDFEDLIET